MNTPARPCRAAAAILAPALALLFLGQAPCPAADDAPQTNASPLSPLLIPMQSFLQHRADAALADFLYAARSPDATTTLFSRIRPPVAPEDDPLRDLDTDALEAEISTFGDLRPRLATDPAACAADLAALTNLARVADALSAPVPYRSSIPPAYTNFTSFCAHCGLFPLEPLPSGTYFGVFLNAAQFLHARALAALAAGDAPAAFDDIDRLASLRALAARDPFAITQLVASAIDSFALPLLAACIDAFPTDRLEALSRRYDRLADAAPAAYRDTLIHEILYAFYSIPIHYAQPDPLHLDEDAPPPVRRQIRFLRRAHRLGLLPAIAAIQQRRLALFARDYIQALPPDGSPLPQSFRDRLRKLSFTNPVLYILTPSLDEFRTGLVAAPRDRATLLRAILAIERYRRAHDGAPPDTLAALVPDYLPAVPLLDDGTPLPYESGDLVPSPTDNTLGSAYSPDAPSTAPAPRRAYRLTLPHPRRHPLSLLFSLPAPYCPGHG